MSNLAIVIPCYKGEFLRKALASLAEQTLKDFVVYIGDDCSPYNIKEIVDEFKNSINIVYHRFKENLGASDLVAHWQRCVDRIGDEKWIWIFSDDDIAENTCVEAFAAALASTAEYFDVYRFNTCVIDRNDNVLSVAKESPTIEAAISLAYYILLSKRGNSMPDHIFKRSAFKEKGGVINFAQAQASDWATSIEFAGEKGLYTISGPKIRWRQSGINVSSLAHLNKARLIYGYLEFISWITKKFSPKDAAMGEVTLVELNKAAKQNFRVVVSSHYRGIPLRELFSVANKVSSIFNESFLKSLKFCLVVNYEVWSAASKSQ